MHSATSPTNTGWKRASARASAITGAIRRSFANRLRNASSRPKITEGWNDRPVEPGRGDRGLGLALAAQVPARARRGRRCSALICTNRRTPAALHAATMLAVQLDVRACECLPARLVEDADEIDRPRRRRAASRASSAGSSTSASTTSTVGSRIQVSRVVAAPRRDDDTPPVGDEPARRRGARRSRCRPPRERDLSAIDRVPGRQPPAAATRRVGAVAARRHRAEPRAAAGRTAARAPARRTSRWRAPSSRSRGSR